MRAGAGGGVAFGQVVKQHDGSKVQTGVEGMFNARVELMPLDAFPSLLMRHYDVGLGYLAEFLDADVPAGSRKQGPYLSGTFYPLLIDDSGPSGNFLWRLGLTVRAEVLFAGVGQGLEMGGGGSLGASFGFASFYEGPFESEDMFGYAFGEVGLEAYVEVAVRYMHDGPYYLLTAGLMFRLPAAVGFMWIW